MEKRAFIGYEYQERTIKRSMSSMYADGYKNFGWELDSISEQLGKLDSVVMKFKRNRRICNKAELTRLQRNFDACVNEIDTLESRKYLVASAIAYSIGIIGTAFMAGSVFAVTAGQIVLCVILAAPALVGWILPYFIYKTVVRKKTAQIMPLIDQKYNELYAVCEKGYSLLDITSYL